MTPPYTFIAVADIHLGWKLYNLPELEQDLRDLFVRICDEAVRLQVTYLVIVGDLFDTNKPTADTVAFVRGQAARLSLAGVTVLGIAGDHDKVVNGESWTSVSGIYPIDRAPQFAAHNYVDQPQVVENHFRNLQNTAGIEWLFAHGQEPLLFSMVSEKKRVCFSQMPLALLFPDLKGIILGDIHLPLEATLVDGGKRFHIGYCGSPGHIKADEVGHKAGLLYYDGTSLSRLPVFPARDFVKLSLKEGSGDPELQIAGLIRKYQDPALKKPVFLVEYDASRKSELSKFAALQHLGFFRSTQRRVAQDGQEESINLRSDMRSSTRFLSVLRDLCPDAGMVDLAFAVLTAEDPRPLLDEFKRRSLGLPAPQQPQPA